MKKLSLVLFCAVMFIGVASAQKVKYGVKGGLNVSNLHGDSDETNSMAGIFIGGFMEYKTSKWAYGVDLLYSQKGAKSDSTPLGATGSEVPEIHLNYISMIPTLKYYLSNNFNIQTGIQFGYNIEAETTYKGTSVDIKDVNDLDVGVILGGEYIFDMGLGLIGRYCAGVNPVYNDESEDVFNGTLQFGVSYRF